MSKDPQDNVPENWGWDWTSETMEEHAIAHAPADRARDEARRPAGAYAKAELSERRAATNDLVGLGKAHREHNAWLESTGRAPETSPTAWAKHAKKDRLGYALAPQDPTTDAWQEPVRERGRHKKGFEYK